jgi:hypothetical protein
MVSPVVFLSWMKLTCGMFFHAGISAQFGGVQDIDQFAPELRQDLNGKRRET